MKFEYINKQIKLTLTLDELRFIHQAFNEVCHGLRVENFNSRIGDIDNVKDEMQRIANVYEKAGDEAVGMVQLDLRIDSIKLYQSVIKVICDEIEAWEFQSRTGETLKRAMEIQADIHKILDEVPSN
jgi:hypothetical protein